MLTVNGNHSIFYYKLMEKNLSYSPFSENNTCMIMKRETTPDNFLNIHL